MTRNTTALAHMKLTRLELAFMAAGLVLMFFAGGWTFYTTQQSMAYEVFTANRA